MIPPPTTAKPVTTTTTQTTKSKTSYKTSPTTSRTTTTTTTTATTTTTTKKPTTISKASGPKLNQTTTLAPVSYDPTLLEPCTSHIDAMMYTPENNVQVLVNERSLWEFDVKKRVWAKKDFYKTYPNLQAGVRGGYRCKKNYTWFFKCKK
jgi:hypothetical protein